MLRIRRRPSPHRERNDGGGSERLPCRDRGGRSGLLLPGIEIVHRCAVRGKLRAGRETRAGPFVDRGRGVV